MLEADGDLAEIGRNHPNLREHIYYKPAVRFDDDISSLLPPSGDRWWEVLCES